MADTPEHEQGKIETKNDSTSKLPTVESPSISPATAEPAIEPVAELQPAASEPMTAATPAADIAGPAPPAARRFKLTARYQRNALLAASVAIAAALGAVVGAVASGGFAAPARSDLARVDETKAMQQSIARLSKEITSLKANVEAANKSAYAQIAKVSERLGRAADEITGSISAPQTVAPVPLPKPAQRVAALEPQAPARRSVLADWRIVDVYDGYVYVQGHGEIFQVSIGAPLPGIGRVEQVKRQDGRWTVVTPKGLIVWQRDRRYFE